ncbi:hypothetical protein [Nitrosomonas sp.]|nr:hypothetical protein [Nitrosomonas sp.]
MEKKDKTNDNKGAKTIAAGKSNTILTGLSWKNQRKKQNHFLIAQDKKVV